METQCSVSGCDRLLGKRSRLIRGMCPMHYQRWRATGDPGPAESRRTEYADGQQCAVDGCEQATPRLKAGLCEMHYQRHRTLGDVGGAESKHIAGGASGRCSVAECDLMAHARGLCQMHYKRLTVHGEIGSAARLRPNAPRRRNPRATRRENELGYVMIKRPGHPNATASGWILEHRFVMAEVLGRPLLPTEYVHHINGVRNDNRSENLELWSSWQPPGQRVEDKAAWAVSFLRQYRPEMIAPAT